MMQPYSPRASFSLFAVRIAFTTNHSLETCKDLLLRRRISTSLWKGSNISYRFKPKNADVWEFYADRAVIKTTVFAKGYFQRIDGATTSVTGYSDTGTSFYWTPILGLIFGIVLAASIYNGTKDGLYVASAIVIGDSLAMAWNLLLTRNKAKELARIIEETLTCTP